MIDEPLVVPVSPGAALVRLTQVSGVLKRHPHIARVLPAGAWEQQQDQRDALLSAIESGERRRIENAWRAAQSSLRRLYETVSQSDAWNESERVGVFTALGFPNPLQHKVQAVDVHTVLATFTMPRKQVLTTLSFEDAPGATAYWLRVVRIINDLPVEDPILESYAPVFTRVRLPSGLERLRIESRNASEFIISEEFEIQVPNEAGLQQSLS